MGVDESVTWYHGLGSVRLAFIDIQHLICQRGLQLVIWILVNCCRVFGFRS